MLHLCIITFLSCEQFSLWLKKKGLYFLPESEWLHLWSVYGTSIPPWPLLPYGWFSVWLCLVMGTLTVCHHWNNARVHWRHVYTNSLVIYSHLLCSWYPSFPVPVRRSCSPAAHLQLQFKFKTTNKLWTVRLLFNGHLRSRSRPGDVLSWAIEKIPCELIYTGSRLQRVKRCKRNL